MVYCGKPSKGCQNCRERKIACDQRVPGCRMCEKHNRTCPGYRNLVDLMFRDESEHVIWKANKSKSRAPRRSSASPTSGTKKKKKQEQRARSAARSSVSPGARSAATPSPVSQSPRVPSTSSGFQPNRETLSPADAKLEPFDASFKTLSLLTPSSTGPSDYFTYKGFKEEASDDDELSLPSPDEGTWPSAPSSAKDYALAPIFQEQGMAFFFSRYVTAAEDNLGRHNYDFIYDIWRPARSPRGRQVDAVLASMTAVGLVAMSTLTRSPERLEWARQSYVTALHLTHAALIDHEEAGKDSTLLAVLILGTYEMLAGPCAETMAAWQGHMRGAAALARLRGPGQFRTKAGIRMFIMLCETLTINCIQQDMPMPAALVELRDVLGGVLTPMDPAWAMASPLYKLLQIRHDIKHGHIENTHAIVHTLLEVDEDFVALIAGIPDSWQYSLTRLTSHNPIAFTPVCHIYPTLENATTWNTLRTLRMAVHETILAELYKYFDSMQGYATPMEHKVQFARSRRLLTQLRDAILATVPQHFGIVSTKSVKHQDPDFQPSYFGPATMSITDDSPYQILSVPPSTLSSPPPSSSASSSSGSSPSSTAFLRSHASEAPTILDFIASANRPTDSDALFMSLTSSPNPLVWPLYLLGVSSSCTPEIRRYVVQRLMAIYMESGLVQAKRVASIVAARGVGSPWGTGEVAQDIPDVSGEPTPVRI